MAVCLEFSEPFDFVPEFWLDLSYRAWTYSSCRQSSITRTSLAAHSQARDARTYTRSSFFEISKSQKSGHAT